MSNARREMNGFQKLITVRNKVVPAVQCMGWCCGPALETANRTFHGDHLLARFLWRTASSTRHSDCRRSEYLVVSPANMRSRTPNNGLEFKPQGCRWIMHRQRILSGISTSRSALP